MPRYNSEGEGIEINPRSGFTTGAVGRNTRHLFNKWRFIPDLGWMHFTDKGSMSKKGPPGIDVAVSNKKQMNSPRFNRTVNIDGENIPLTAYIANSPDDPTGGGPNDAQGNPVVPFNEQGTYSQFSEPANTNQLTEGSQTNLTGDQPVSGNVEGPTATWSDYSTPEQLSGLGAEFTDINTDPIEIGTSPETTPTQESSPAPEFNTGSAPLTFGEFVPGSVNFQAPGNSGEESFSPTFDPSTPGFEPDPVDSSAYNGAWGDSGYGDFGASTVPLVGQADSGVPGGGSNDLAVTGGENGTWSDASSPVESSGPSAGPGPTSIYDPYGSAFMGGFDPNYTSPNFSPDPVISPGVSSPFSDAMLLPGATSGLGGSGAGSVAGLNPFRNVWGGNHPLNEQTFNDFVGWQNSQGNAMAGANWGNDTGMFAHGPITYGPTSGGNYGNYLTSWNQVNSMPSGPAFSQPWGDTSQASHSGVTLAR